MLEPGEEPGLEAVGYYAPPQSTFASGCHVAQVEVDPATGGVRILRYVVQHDMPAAMEIPDVEIVHTQTPSPLNPLGVKGVGEAGAIPGPAVLAEAIEDALAPLGVRIREMPLSPGRLRELIDAARLAATSAAGANRLRS